jgi:hypothetical protein
MFSCFPFKNDDKKSGELIAALKTSYCDYSREYFLVQLKSAVINQKVLPPLAVPKEFFILDQWMTPMTPHGKLDKQRLLSELIKRSSHRIELADVIFHQADVTLVEVSSWSKRIHALYSAILHDGSMPLKDNSNLLAEGGTSIDATLIAVKLESILRMEYENLPADICER